MTDYFRRIFVVSVLIAGMLALLVALAAGTEIYSSVDSEYPYHFTYNPTSADASPLGYMDAVSFAGKDIVFFTLQAYGPIYWYTPGASPVSSGWVDIGNRPDLYFRFKTCVFGSTLYIFYTTDSTAASKYGFDSTKIYYRTATVDYVMNPNTNPNGWTLVFSEQKSLTGAGWPAYIQMTAVMNGKMHIIFASSVLTEGATTVKKWDYISSSDGLAFGPATQFYKDVGTNANYGDGPDSMASGAVFLVPDSNSPSNFVEKLMVAQGWGGTGTIRYFFFDGVNPVTTVHYTDTGENRVTSVRLMAGSAEGYQVGVSPKNFSVQVFSAIPKKDILYPHRWCRIDHAEYIPGGPNGDAGTWTGWSQLDLSNDEKIRGFYYDNYSDYGWAVIPSFKTENDTNVRTLISIYYYTGDRTHAISSSLAEQYIDFRCSTYQSDLMVWEGETRVEPADTDSTQSTVLGVIEGTPPYPVNTGIVPNVGLNTSVTEFGFTKENSISTTVTTDGAGSFWFGNTNENLFVPNVASSKWQVKFTQGLKYAHGWQTRQSVQTNYTLRNFTDTPPGDLTWQIVFRPEIVTNVYTLKGYDGGVLAYNWDNSGKLFRCCFISYGENSVIEFQPYYLEYPSVPIGGTLNSPPRTDTAGMEARPLSDDVLAWKTVTADYLTPDPSYTITKLPLTLSSDQGVTNIINILQTQIRTDTWTPYFNCTVSKEKVGIGPNYGVSGSITVQQEIKTETSMQGKLGFYLNVPECCNSLYQTCTGLTCIQKVEVIPALLMPVVDNRGLPTDDAYNAPWISDEFRNNKGDGRALPWLLTYLTYPSDPIVQGALGVRPTLNKLTVKKAHAMVQVDQVKPNSDRVLFSLDLAGVDPDFSIDKRQFVHLRFGNYVFDSNTNPVLSRQVVGKKLILDLEAPTNSDATVRIVLSYYENQHRLNAQLVAHGVELSGITPYLENAGGGKIDTFPFSLMIGSRYTAEANLSGKVTVNDQKIICELHLQK